MRVFYVRVVCWGGGGCGEGGPPAIPWFCIVVFLLLPVAGAGWVTVYRLFLVKVPIVQEMMGLKDPRKPGPAPRPAPPAAPRR